MSDPRPRAVVGLVCAALSLVALSLVTPSVVGSAETDAVLPPPAPGPRLIDEDFATSAENLVPIAGAWAVAVGRYTLSAPDDQGEEVPNANLSVHDTVVTGDFTLTATASTTPTDSPFNDFSIVFGYRDPENYSFASFSEGNDANTSGLFSVVGGQRAELADITVPVVAGAVYPIRVERVGTAVRVFRAEEEVASATDPTFTSGRVGFGSRNDGATFDDLAVTGPAPPPPPPEPPGVVAQVWAWITSLFTGGDAGQASGAVRPVMAGFLSCSRIDAAEPTMSGSGRPTTSSSLSG